MLFRVTLPVYAFITVEVDVSEREKVLGSALRRALREHERTEWLFDSQEYLRGYDEYVEEVSA